MLLSYFFINPLSGIFSIIVCKYKNFLVSKNKFTISIIPVSSLKELDSDDFIKLNEYILNESFIGYLDLFSVKFFIISMVILSIIILLMNNTSSSGNMATTDQGQIRPTERKQELTYRLLVQLNYNIENRWNKLNYRSFPVEHPGHLTLEKQAQLVEILKGSYLKDEYRFGASLGKFYLKNSNEHPNVTDKIVGVVMADELQYG